MLDPLSSVVICVFIAKAAIDIFRDAVDKMVDHSCDEATERAIRGCVMGHDGVEAIDLLRTREFGNRVYIELEISVDGGACIGHFFHQRGQATSLSISYKRSISYSFPQNRFEGRDIAAL